MNLHALPSHVYGEYLALNSQEHLKGFQEGFAAESGFQVLYYKGMSLDSLGQPYPLGTCRHDDYSGNPLLFPDINAESCLLIATRDSFGGWPTIPNRLPSKLF